MFLKILLLLFGSQVKAQGFNFGNPANIGLYYANKYGGFGRPMNNQQGSSNHYGPSIPYVDYIPQGIPFVSDGNGFSNNFGNNYGNNYGNNQNIPQTTPNNYASHSSTQNYGFSLGFNFGTQPNQQRPSGRPDGGRPQYQEQQPNGNPQYGRPEGGRPPYQQEIPYEGNNAQDQRPFEGRPQEQKPFEGRPQEQKPFEDRPQEQRPPPGIPQQVRPQDDVRPTQDQVQQGNRPGLNNQELAGNGINRPTPNSIPDRPAVDTTAATTELSSKPAVKDEEEKFDIDVRFKDE